MVVLAVKKYFVGWVDGEKLKGTGKFL